MGIGPKSIKVVFGCCGDCFRTAEELSAHQNVAGFKFRVSTIKNFDKNTFDYRQQFLFKMRKSNVTPQAASRREQEKARRHRVCTLDKSEVITATFSSPVVVRKRVFSGEELEGTPVFRKTPKLPSEPNSPENLPLPCESSISSTKPEGNFEPGSVSLTSVLKDRTNLPVTPKPVLSEPHPVQVRAPVTSSNRLTKDSRALRRVRKLKQKPMKSNCELSCRAQPVMKPEDPACWGRLRMRSSHFCRHCRQFRHRNVPQRKLVN